MGDDDCDIGEKVSGVLANTSKDAMDMSRALHFIVRGYFMLYGIFSAVVIGAMLRMWALEIAEERLGVLSPGHKKIVGYGTLGLTGLTVLGMMLYGGRPVPCLALAGFNTFLLFKCTERFIVQVAV